MYIFFLPLIFLPLLEIFAFVRISSALGLGLAFLWLVCGTLLGFSLMKARGAGAWSRIQKQSDDIFAAADLFDGVCITIGAVLLIFPGFISDFIAIPFLVGPLRRRFFQRLKSNPDSFVRRYAKPGTFRDEKPNNTVIDGEFRNIDNSDHLTPP